jgi:hypothetical protein
MVLRARYYDPLTGEFISPDPLEYVDGMSLYRGYFVILSVDPDGRKVEFQFCQFVAKDPTLLDKCGRAVAEMRFSIKTNPKLGGNLFDLNGWIIQKVETYKHIVSCETGEILRDKSDCFYEALLEVKDGQLYLPNTNQLESIDRFETETEPGEGTFGAAVLFGQVAFVRNFNLDPKFWKKAPLGHPAKGLPIRECTQEEFDAGEGSLNTLDGWKPTFKRKLQSEWYCCDCKSRRRDTDLSLSFGWVNKCSDFVAK